MQHHQGSTDVKLRGDLGVDEAFDRGALVVQRIGWAGMALVLAAALLGLFGSGPLSWRSAWSDEGTLLLRYERFARANANQELLAQLIAPPGSVPQAPGRRGMRDVREIRELLETGAMLEAPHSPPMEVAIDDAYLQGFNLVDIDPPALSVRTEEGMRIFRFDVGCLEGAQFAVRFTLAPRRPGSHAGWIGGESGDRASFRQFVWP
jgi:hypothetical protein